MAKKIESDNARELSIITERSSTTTQQDVYYDFFRIALELYEAHWTRRFVR